MGPYHIATYAYDMTGGGGAGASAASVVQLVSYAEDGVGDSKALSDCHSIPNGCKTVLYMDPNHVINNSSSACTYHPAAEILAAASEAWFVHDSGYSDSSHRVYGSRPNGCSAWAMNPNSVSYQTWWRNYLRANADGYDLYFLDDDYMMLFKEMWFTSGGGCQPWPSKCFSTQEISDDAHMVLAHANLVDGLSHSDGTPMQFLYQQSSRNPALDASAFTTSSRFVGMTCEGCISSARYPALTSVYATTLDEMAAVNAAGGMFLLISQGNAPTGSATQSLQRFLTAGFTWLGYKEGFTAVESDLEGGSTNLAIWPEDLIYPSVPLQSMTAGHTDLQVASGVYRREFGTCYQKGVYFGACASVVNGTSSAITVSSSWLTRSYHHMVTIAGGDVGSGGVANVSGASFVANSTTVQAGGAILLTP